MNAVGLMRLGFKPLVDFIAQDDGDGPYIKEWLSGQSQPSDTAIEEAAETPFIPQSISPLQARKALRQAGLKAQVDAYVATLSEEEQEEWEYATQVRRDHPVIVDGGAALGMTEEQIDELFILGAGL